MPAAPGGEKPDLVHQRYTPGGSATLRRASACTPRALFTTRVMPVAMGLCAIRISGSCHSDPAAHLGEWFDDGRQGGGVKKPSREDCFRRARSWQTDCTDSAFVQVWYRGDQEPISTNRRGLVQASLLPCLTHQYHGCPEVGEWPTLVSGACPDGWDRSRLGVCYQRSSLAGGAQNWRCPLTAQRLQHPPFCAPSEAMIASKHDLSYPVLRCYALRYTDLQRVFCQGRRMKLLQNCRWQQILQHYRVYGNLEGRKLDCEGVTLDHEYMSDPRYPHVLLSSSTANMLSRQPGNLAQMRPSESLPQQPRAPSSIISGSVCGGLTNQDDVFRHIVLRDC